MTARPAINPNDFLQRDGSNELYADTDMWLAQGDGTITVAVPAVAPQSNVAAFLPAQTGRLYALGGDKQSQYTHIAAIVASGTGTLYISELE